MRVQLPSRFRPKLHAGHSVAGICLIRLDSIRPRFVPRLLGLSSENAAHRVAVRWRADGATRRRVHSAPGHRVGHEPSCRRSALPRRASPGSFHRARELGPHRPQHAVRRSPSVGEGPREAGGPPSQLVVFFVSHRGVSLLRARVSRLLRDADAGRLDGIELRTHGWSVEPLQVEEVHSSYFSDEARFPKESVVFDCALVMRNLGHEWHSADDLYV
jgi:hypothetical protein